MTLPVNTFTIHNLLGFMVTGSLAVMFYLLYAGMGRRLLDLLAANFIACSALMCLSSFLSDNVIRAGMSCLGWPGGPGPQELSQATLLFHRMHWTFAMLLMPAQLHFVLCYCDSRNFLRRHIRVFYLVAIMLVPLIWTSVWFQARETPLAETSSWGVAIPWMPIAGQPVLPFILAWVAQQAYILVLLWRTRRRPGPTLDEASRQWGLVFLAFMVQIAIGLLDPISVLMDYTGISFIPIGAMMMGVLLAAALIRSRIITHRTQVRLESEKAVLLESVQQPLICVDTNYRVSWANPGGAKLAGTDVPQLIGRHAQEIWGGSDAPEMRPIESAMRTGRTQRRELTRRDGSAWVLYASPVMSEKEGMLGVILLAMDVTAIRQAEEALRRANSQILVAREEERRRVAKELHDSLAQRWAVMQLGLHMGAMSLGGQVEASDLLFKAADECKEAIRELRHICYELYPPALDILGLGRALDEMADKYQAAGKECTVDCSPRLKKARFPRDVEISLYRVCQEAVNNAVRHGKAGRIAFALDYEDNQLSLAVTDNGIGFNPEDVSKYGMGMNSMKSRLMGIGGTLDISSEPGQTRVLARVPCLPAEDRAMAAG